MKKFILLAFMCSFMIASDSGYKMIKVLPDATSSNNSKEFNVDERPDGFIIKEAKEEIVFNKEGKVLDKNGDIKLIRLNVRFDFDKYDLKDEYKDEIDEAVNFVKKHPTLSVSIDGHADSTGTLEYNQALSERRATTVAHRLQELGVKKAKMIVKGHGELKPIVPNTTEANRAKNRRVDISFNR